MLSGKKRGPSSPMALLLTAKRMFPELPKIADSLPYIKEEAVPEPQPPNEFYKLGCIPLQLFCIMHIKPRKFIHL